MNDSNLSYDRLYEYQVIGSGGHAVGIIEGMWANRDTGALEYVGVKTGLIFNAMHMMPVSEMTVDHATRAVRVPYTDTQVNDAPTFSLHAELTAEDKAAIMQHYVDTRGRAPADHNLP